MASSRASSMDATGLVDLRTAQDAPGGIPAGHADAWDAGGDDATGRDELSSEKDAGGAGDALGGPAGCAGAWDAGGDHTTGRVELSSEQDDGSAGDALGGVTAGRVDAWDDGGDHTAGRFELSSEKDAGGAGDALGGSPAGEVDAEDADQITGPASTCSDSLSNSAHVQDVEEELMRTNIRMAEFENALEGNLRDHNNLRIELEAKNERIAQLEEQLRKSSGCCVIQ